MSKICLITALPSEARPLISHFRLKNAAHSHLRLYESPNCALLQCGVGKLNAAASTAAMLAHWPNVDAIINVGISGADRPIGETLLAHQIKDGGSGQKWFPHLPAQKHLPDTQTINVVTVDKPDTNYSKDTAFDMEAAGIVAAATKHLDLAFIQCVKVVSDNTEHNINNINMQLVTESISRAVPVIEKVMNSLPFYSQPNVQSIHDCVEVVVRQIHHTETQKHQLKKLLQRYCALNGALPPVSSLTENTTAKTTLTKLQNQMRDVEVSY